MSPVTEDRIYILTIVAWKDLVSGKEGLSI